MLLRLLLVACCLCSITPAEAQRSAQKIPVSAKKETIEMYIHAGWDTLSRSMTDCSSFVDPKLKSVPVLYLPKDFSAPAKIKRLERSCNVRVLSLPRKITEFGQMKEKDLSVQGLLYLPNPYVVPGGRFNEMYGWDSYFILLGLVADQKVSLAKGMVENFFFEIDHYGGILNANRTYYFTRSQPPFLSSMILLLYEANRNALSGKEKAIDSVWLEKAYGYAKRDYSLWQRDIHRAGETGLARYFDIGEGPVPEMEDDSSYYGDVIRWLLAHPEVKTEYLVKASEHPAEEEAKELAEKSCNLKTSKVCERAYYSGYRLSKGFYLGDRAMRESGFDVSFRYGPFSGDTHHYADVSLNSLLYKYEQDLSFLARELHHDQEAQEWKARAAQRRERMNAYFWNQEKGMYFDYDYIRAKQSSYEYATTFYPLWSGAASCEQAQAVEKNSNKFERSGGLLTSTTESGMQWDAPYGWAPLNWIAVYGLAQYDFSEEAQKISQAFRQTVEKNYLSDKTIREKYNVASGSSDIAVSAGYKQNVVGFGWTNGVYLQMEKLQNTKVVSLCGGKP